MKFLKTSHFSTNCLAPVTGGVAFHSKDDDSYLAGLATGRMSKIRPKVNDLTEVPQDLHLFKDACSSVSTNSSFWAATSFSGEVALGRMDEFAAYTWSFPSQTCTSSCVAGSDVFVGMEFDVLRHLRGDTKSDPLWQSSVLLSVEDMELIDQEVLLTVGTSGLFMHDLRVAKPACSLPLANLTSVCRRPGTTSFVVGDASGGVNWLDTRKFSSKHQQHQDLGRGIGISQLAFTETLVLVGALENGRLATFNGSSWNLPSQSLVRATAGLCAGQERDVLIAGADGSVILQSI